MEFPAGQNPSIAPVSTPDEPRKVPNCHSSPAVITAPSRPRKKSLSRAIQGLLNTPHPPGSASCGSGAVSPGARASRSPVAPLFSSPLRNSSSIMASAPSSPERHNGDATQPRRSLDLTREGPLGAEETKNEALTSVSEQNLPKKYKPNSRKSVASMMSGLESRLFPKSFTRGRDTSRGSSRRGSSVDSRSPSSSKLDNESPPSANTSTNNDMSKRSSLVISEEAHNQSDEALAKPAGGLPDYVKPSEENEPGERLAKDVFDRDKNIILSSDEETSSDEEQDGQPRGRKKKVDVTFITPSDFRPKETKEQKEETSDTGNLSLGI